MCDMFTFDPLGTIHYEASHCKTINLLFITATVATAAMAATEAATTTTATTTRSQSNIQWKIMHCQDGERKLEYLLLGDITRNKILFIFFLTGKQTLIYASNDTTHFP